ncbi:hypothetical protein Paride_0289 [Pseudomonas phage Paride]|nr:hypothetical protein Paride_0289 [Pseudomonas phage Paride]
MVYNLIFISFNVSLISFSIFNKTFEVYIYGKMLLVIYYTGLHIC